MGYSLFRDTGKKFRFARSFLRKKLTHCNLQLLYTCNFKCKICDFWKKPYTTHPRLSLSDMEIIAGKINTLGPLVISIGGGEPLLHKDLLPMARVLSRRHFPVMISNGWFMTAEKARALWEAGFYEISISLDYADPEKHDRQRGVEGAYERAVTALSVLHETRKHPHQRVNMISVVMEDNLSDMEPLIALSATLGISFLVTLYSHNRGRKRGESYPDDMVEHLLELKKKHRHFVALRGYLERFREATGDENGVTPCFAGKSLFNIDSQGNATLCIDTLDDPAGNLLTDDMDHIVKRLLEKHRSNTCGECWTSCRGPVETLMYGDKKSLAPNLIDYYQMTRDVAIGTCF